MFCCCVYSEHGGARARLSLVSLSESLSLSFACVAGRVIFRKPETISQKARRGNVYTVRLCYALKLAGMARTAARCAHACQRQQREGKAPQSVTIHPLGESEQPAAQRGRSTRQGAAAEAALLSGIRLR